MIVRPGLATKAAKVSAGSPAKTARPPVANSKAWVRVTGDDDIGIDRENEDSGEQPHIAETSPYSEPAAGLRCAARLIVNSTIMILSPRVNTKGEIHDEEHAPPSSTENWWEAPDVAEIHGGTGCGHDETDTAGRVLAAERLLGVIVLVHAASIVTAKYGLWLHNRGVPGAPSHGRQRSSAHHEQ